MRIALKTQRLLVVGAKQCSANQQWNMSVPTVQVGYNPYIGLIRKMKPYATRQLSLNEYVKYVDPQMEMSTAFACLLLLIPMLRHTQGMLEQYWKFLTWILFVIDIT